MDKPNVVLIVTDQQRADTLGCSGNKVCKTPNLDNLAKKGIFFAKTYAQNTVCAPSRGSFLTGRYPRICHISANGMTMPVAEKILPYYLHKRGYFCGLFGKLHLSPCEEGRTELRREGFDVWEWSHDPTHSSPENRYHLWLKQVAPRFWETYKKKGEPNYKSELRAFRSIVPPELHHTHWIIEKAISFIEENKDKPFFAFINIFEPHHPFCPPGNFFGLYKPENVPMYIYKEGELNNKPVTQLKEHNHAYGFMKDGFASLTVKERLEAKAAYYGMVTHIDFEVGRLLKVLEDLDLRKDTIVIFTSDHGEMLGDHGLFLKGPHFYEEAIRVPCIISWPGYLLCEKRVEGLVELASLMPTILELLNIPVPRGVQSKSLVNICTEEKLESDREWVIAEYRNSNYKTQPALATMLRTNDYKIVVCHGEELGELYDLNKDPNEFNNLWENPPYKEIKQKMIKKLLDILVETEDPLPQKETNW